MVGPLAILIGCMIFLSPFLDVKRMSMPTVSLLAHLCSLPAECFSLTYDLNVFKSRINRKLFSLGSFYTALLYDVHVFLLFLLALCLVVAVQLCME